MSEQAADGHAPAGRVWSATRWTRHYRCIERRVKHPLYGKFVRKSTKVMTHDENNECQIGDIVMVRAVPAAVEEPRSGVKSSNWSSAEQRI